MKNGKIKLHNETIKRLKAVTQLLSTCEPGEKPASLDAFEASLIVRDAETILKHLRRSFED